ncbi:MAG: hypothetical protein M1822_002449 [Bathelium mastoideum]|nr:MAG: hypothetical protein M1822_002449 [Bathelium mastoideum]
MTEQPKRIIVYCDGTGNSIYDHSQDGRFSNVSRIRRCMKNVSADGTQQIGIYEQGIGTHEENPVRRLAKGSGRGHFIALTMKEDTDKDTVGIEEKIKSVYEGICHNYATSGDQIILVGFSRGAFVVRCVADLICRIGLLTQRGLRYLNVVCRKWSECNGATYPLTEPRSEDRNNESTFSVRRVNDTGRGTNTFTVREESASREPDANDPNAFDSLLENKKLLRRQIRIKACVVWDTVAAIGRRLTFVDSELLDGIDNAFHALALHERRRDFFPIIWKTSEGALRQRNTRLQQCWFVGYHSNVGGSSNPDSLAHISLAWVMARLQDFVEFDIDNFCQPPPKGSNWALKSARNGKINGFPRTPLQVS